MGIKLKLTISILLCWGLFIVLPIGAAAPTVTVLNNKTSICSNGTDFTSLVVTYPLVVGSTVTYQWKKGGVYYTGKGSTSNNIRPTTGGIYSCDVTVTTLSPISSITYASNGVTIVANATCNTFATYKTALPIFVVSTNGQGFPGRTTCLAGCTPAKDKRECDVKIIWNGENQFNNMTDMANNSVVYYDRKAIMSYRGSTSITMAKKPYAFDTAKKDLENGVAVKGNVDMFALPEEKDWILYPSYGEKSMMRNKLAMDLYREMGYYASNMRYVDLFIDGDYKGVYIFMEKYKQDVGRINITEDFAVASPEEIGYIFKLDKVDSYSAPEVWRRDVSFCGGLCGDSTICTTAPLADVACAGIGSRGYELLYPEADEAANYTAKKEYIKNFVQGFEQSLNAAHSDADFEALFKNYIDLKSFVDYFILAEFARNTDSYRISMYFYKDSGGLIKCSPMWDFEMGFGNSKTHGGYNTDIWQYNYYGDEPANSLVNGMSEPYFPIPFWWKKLMTSSCFKNVLRTRWEELRQNVLSSSNIESKINAYQAILGTDVDNVPNTSPMGRNKARWPWTTINACSQMYTACPWMVMTWPANYSGVGNAAGKTTSFSGEEVPILKAWISNRVSWLDTQIENSSFGILLTDEEVRECAQLPADIGTNTNKTKQAVTENILITAENYTITVQSLNKKPLSEVLIYDINGVLVSQKSNINDFYCEFSSPLMNDKILVVKVLTPYSVLTRVVLVK